MCFRVGVGVALAAAVFAFGCGNNSQQQAPAADAQKCDGPIRVDSAPLPDAAIDASVDARIVPDVMYDAPPTCPLALPDPIIPDTLLPSPACASGASQIYEVGNYRIRTIAAVGDLLYVGWFEPSSNGGVQTGGVEEYNLVTNSHRPVLETFGAPAISQSNGHIWISDSNDNRVWLLGPGVVPTPVAYDITNGAYFQSDATHLYWVGSDPTQHAKVYRQPICGGARETLMDCESARALQLVGDDVYCGSLYGEIKRIPKTGGVETVVVERGTFLGDFQVIGGQLIVQEFFGRLYKMDLATNVKQNIAQLPNGDRAIELLVSDLFYYVFGEGGIFRVRRTGTATVQKIYTPPLFLSSPSATFAKGGLLFVRPDSFVERCVN